MAFIGLRHPVVATIDSYTPGSVPTYEDGMVMGAAITANLSITRNDNPLYADDVITEDDNGITAMSLELGLDDLPETVQEYMLGVVEESDAYVDSDASSPEVGMGYIRVRRKGGVTSYQGVWLYKVRFSMNDENSQTKGESIEWQTPTVTGRVVGVDLDGSGVMVFRARQLFDNEADAIDWLETLADI